MDEKLKQERIKKISECRSLIRSLIKEIGRQINNIKEAHKDDLPIAVGDKFAFLGGKKNVHAILTGVNLADDLEVDTFKYKKILVSGEVSTTERRGYSWEWERVVKVDD